MFRGHSDFVPPHGAIDHTFQGNFSHWHAPLHLTGLDLCEGKKK